MSLVDFSRHRYASFGGENPREKKHANVKEKNDNINYNHITIGRHYENGFEKHTETRIASRGCCECLSSVFLRKKFRVLLL